MYIVVCDDTDVDRYTEKPGHGIVNKVSMRDRNATYYWYMCTNLRH